VFLFSGRHDARRHSRTPHFNPQPSTHSTLYFFFPSFPHPQLWAAYWMSLTNPPEAKLPGQNRKAASSAELTMKPPRDFSMSSTAVSPDELRRYGMNWRR
jgi:hypothetical protein